MRHWLHKLRVLTGVNYAYMLEYRAELYLWALSGIMPFFMMGLWMQASRDGALATDPAGFARYFLAVFVVRQLTIVWVVWEIEYDVVNGRLSPYLLQPLNPFWRYFAGHLGERLARLPFIAALVALFFLLYPAALARPPLAALLLAIPALVAAFLLRFIMQYAFGMLTFWIERANAIEDLFFMLYLFLSGFLAPLDLFPEGVRRVALLTPFPYLVYLPAQLLTGTVPPNLLFGAGVMAAWGALFWGLYRLGWKLGLRRFSAMGA
jgi:ABC-2 type transport system permease protein